MNPWLCPISSFTMRPVDTAPRRSAGPAVRPGTAFRPAGRECGITVLPARFPPTVAAAGTAAAARRLGTRLVDGEVSAANLCPVQRGDRVLRLLVGAHLDERKPTRTTGHSIAQYRQRHDRYSPT